MMESGAKPVADGGNLLANRRPRANGTTRTGTWWILVLSGSRQRTVTRMAHDDRQPPRGAGAPTPLPA